MKAKTWQIFILLILGIFISNFSIDNDPVFTSLISILGGVIYFIYPFSLAHLLQVYLPSRVKLSHNFYLINTFIWAATYSSIIIITDGRGMVFRGFMLILMLYVSFAFLYFLAFPAITLKSIELNREANFGDYIGDIILIMFLPIGIWFLHPRVKKILVEKDIKS